MWSTIKKMPVLAKIIIACLILVVIAKATHSRHAAPVNFDNRDTQVYSQGEVDRAAGESDARTRLLAQFKAAQAQLQARAQACMAQMQQATNQMANAAANGVMPSGQAPCQQYMPQMIAQEAYYETEIYKLQGGDPHASVRDFVPNVPQSGGGSYSPSSPSGSDRDLNAADNWDRQAIRGNQLYTDEQGTQRELPSHDYYYRDRATGQLVGSESPNAPDNTRDWEQITPQPQQ